MSSRPGAMLVGLIILGLAIHQIGFPFLDLIELKTYDLRVAARDTRPASGVVTLADFVPTTAVAIDSGISGTPPGATAPIPATDFLGICPQDLPTYPNSGSGMQQSSPEYRDRGVFEVPR